MIFYIIFALNTQWTYLGYHGHSLPEQIHRYRALAENNVVVMHSSCHYDSLFLIILVDIYSSQSGMWD